MIKKIKKFINNKSGKAGSIYIYGIFILYVCILLSIALNKYYIMWTNGLRVKEAMKEACISVLTSNWDDIYSSLIEGYAGGYDYEGEETLDSDRVYEIMEKELGTKKVDGAYVLYSGNEVVYKYYDIITEINNTGYKNRDEALNIYLELTYEVPFKILHIEFPMAIKLKNKAIWRAKY